VVLNTNNTAAIVSAMDVAAKIRKKVSKENVAMFFSPARNLCIASLQWRLSLYEWRIKTCDETCASAVALSGLTSGNMLIVRVLSVECGLRVKASKYVSYLLRHDSQGLVMDEEGFVDLDALVSKVKESFPSVDEGFLRRLVEESERKRFEIVGNRIRALYGHSVPVYLRLEEDTHVEYLFHGTTEEAAKEILGKGLKPMKRMWVHLSPTIHIATQVGKRRTSKPIILVVSCAEARKIGLRFYKASDQAYLCECVPAKYIRGLCLVH
jgi:putative RNA 2'-phosphotransferase